MIAIFFYFVIMNVGDYMDCIFCKIANGEIPSDKLYEDELVLAIMDANPNVDGHVLIIPKKHYEDYRELDKDITFNIFQLAQNLGPQIMEKLNTNTMTLLINYGEAQKVKHFHLHLLPNLGAIPTTSTKSKEEIYSILKVDNN